MVKVVPNVQVLINGLVSGSAIALLAMAFQAVYLPTRVFFLGLAGVYSFSPYIAHMARAHEWPWVFAILLSVMVGVALASFFEWCNHSRLARKRASEGVHLIASLGLYIITVQLIAILWGDDPKTLRTVVDDVTKFGEIVISGAQWMIASVALILLSGFAVFLRFSNLGLRLRAMADNPVQFTLFGFDPEFHRYVAFCLAGLFAASASLVTAYDIGFDPHGGLHALLLAVVAVIIGGQGSFLGPILGGLLIGMVRSQMVWHFSARWQEAATFGLFALFLLVRPQGLLGRKTRLEAAV